MDPCETPTELPILNSSQRVYVESEDVLSILQEIENEAKGPQSKSPPPQKNHMKANLKRLREIQTKSQQKIAEKKTFKPLKVPNSHLETAFKNTGREAEIETRRMQPPKTAGSIRSQQMLPPPSRSSCRSNISSSRSLPQLNNLEDLESLSPRSIPDSLVSVHSLACSRKSSEKPDTRHKLGQIPSYLTERKKEWEKEKERQKKIQEAASIPAGYTLLPDEERLETLDLLRKNQGELLQNLSTLPVRNDTIRLRHYKEELEKQLAKVEEGIKIFSRPKVLIKNDDDT